jgi:DNA-binding GntR family transcriptional regulator
LLEEGYVERLPGRGFSVARITLKSIQDTFDVRRALESEAAAGAALRRDASALDRLRALAPLPQGVGEGAAEAARLANASFHLGVAEASGNVLLVSLVRRCLDQVDRFLLHGIRVQAVPAQITVEHLEIVEAISRQDPLAAGRAMEQHLDACRQQILQALVAGDRQQIAV